MSAAPEYDPWETTRYIPPDQQDWPDAEEKPPAAAAHVSPQLRRYVGVAVLLGLPALYILAHLVVLLWRSG